MDKPDSNENQTKPDSKIDFKRIRINVAIKLSQTDNVPSEIFSGFFIGSVGSAMSFNVLKSIGITHILCVADNIMPIFPDDFVYHVISIPDLPQVNLLQILPRAFDFINLGITHGVSRSASVCIAYLMVRFHWNFQQAYLFVKDKRANIEPNPGFKLQLENIRFFSI